jgi:hypothetical protein
LGVLARRKAARVHGSIRAVPAIVAIAAEFRDLHAVRVGSIFPATRAAVSPTGAAE